jgi:DNA-binding MurR/RpiR family transcriptional regulator
MEDSDGGIAVTMRRRLGECSLAERKVGRALLAAYPAAGFETASRLAARAGVSAQTVIRFVNRLGFSGFPEFQQALRDEIEDRSASPWGRLAADVFDRESMTGEGALDRVAQAMRDSFVDAFQTIPRDEFTQAIKLIVDPSRRLMIAGGRISGLLAEYLGRHLIQMRADTQVLPNGLVERAVALGGVGRKDVLVLFDFRRYEEPLFELAKAAHARGASIVLVTDTWLSPVSQVAAVVLPMPVTGPLPFNSLAATFAVLETIVAVVLAELGDSARKRMVACEQFARDAALF